MKPITRRLRKLETRFGPPVETKFDRQLRARIEAGRRRVAPWREQQGISVRDLVEMVSVNVPIVALFRIVATALNGTAVWWVALLRC